LGNITVYIASIQLEQFRIEAKLLLNLTDLSSEPLQSQISRRIRAKILNGDLVAGMMLPSIRKLAREQKVSVITVQRGYEALENEGLIHSRRGKGFFVSPLQNDQKKEMAQNKLKDALMPVIKNAVEEGMNIQEIESVVKEILLKG
jgi:GntR family transcriptional regulator